MYKKIDIFCNGKYVCSTNWAKSLKQAKENFLKNPTWQGVGGVEKLTDNFQGCYNISVSFA